MIYDLLALGVVKLTFIIHERRMLVFSVQNYSFATFLQLYYIPA